MPFAELVTYILNFVRRSLQLEMNSFTKILKKSDISKQAFSQARKKLSPEVFKLLNAKLVTEFYTDNDFITYKGLRVLAIDGSVYRLPKFDELYKEYGTNRENDLSIPLANGSALYDVLNKFTIHATLKPYRFAEKDMAMEHFQELFKFDALIPDNNVRDLLMFDRGYAGTFIFFFLHSKKKDFLIRSSGTIREVNEVIESGLNDSIISVPPFKVKKDRSIDFVEYLPELTQKSHINVRVVVFDLPNKQKEIIITSLLDQNEFTREDIYRLYGKRWNVEENYKLQKNIAEIENFSGKSKLAIEQDFFATIFTCNLASIVAQEAQDEIDQELSNKNLKHSYKVNRNILIGTIKDEIIEVLFGNHDLVEYCDGLKQKLKKNLIPILPGRSFPREVNRRKADHIRKKGCL